MISFQSRKKTSKKRILDFSLAMTILIGLSSLPFLHELILDNDGVPHGWVPDLDIAKTLTDSQGKILGYSRYHVLMYFLLIQVYTFIAWIGWFSVSKFKPYRLAILLGVISSFYQIFLIVTNRRNTILNSVDIKLIAAGAIALFLFLIYRYNHKRREQKLKYVQEQFGHKPNKSLNYRSVLAWLALILISTGPYFHDIITTSGVGVKAWVPKIGVESFLTDTEGYVWGFNSYRVFLLTISLHVFAQIGWAGWLHDSIYKRYRPFLLVPVGLSFYQIVVVFLDQTEAYMNRPDFKLLIILAIGALVCYLYFFKNKKYNTITIDGNDVSQTI